MSEPILEIKNLHVRYGAVHAVRGISFNVPQKSIVTLIGANGAGKSTTLRTISGLLRPASGEIYYQGAPIHSVPGYRLVPMGLSQSPEGRGVFPSLTVLENLEMGAFTQPADRCQENMEKAFKLFPRLNERLKQKAGTLSGGEQQMLAIARALMSDPKVLLLDEPSLGLAPQIVKTIFTIIQEINALGTSVLLVEQNARMALQVAHKGYVLETGTLTLEGAGKDLLNNPKVKSAYLGG